MQQYTENREELLKQGITSFSGYVTRFLYDALEQAAQRTHWPLTPASRPLALASGKLPLAPTPGANLATIQK